MGDLRTSIIVDLSGNLQAKARQFTSGMVTLGSKGSRSMTLLSSSMVKASNGLDRLGNRYTALFTGAAGIGALRQVGNLEERLTRLGIQANRTEAEMDALKKKIFETALDPDIRVDPGKLFSAIEEIIEKTGDLSYAEANIRNIGLAIQATGAEGDAIGGILAEFEKMNLGAKESLEALDLLTLQGKEGAFTLENLASLGSRVVTAYTAMGRTGVPAIREMGAALQVIRQGTGSSEMAATAFEALLRTLSDAEKVKMLQQGGIQIFEPGSTTVMRSLPKIMEDIIRKTKGSKMALSKIFDAEAIRAFNAAIGEFQKTGNVESLDRFYRIQADGSTITNDSIRAASKFNASLTGLYVIWQKFADNQLAEPIKDLTAYLNSLEPGTVERWLSIGKNIALITGGTIVANKLVRGGLSTYRAFSKTGGLAAGALGSGVVPVYVVNEGFGAATSGIGKKAATGTAAGLLTRAGLASLPVLFAATVGGLTIYGSKKKTEWHAKMLDTESLRETIRRNEVLGCHAGTFEAMDIFQAELDRRDTATLNKTIGEARLKILIESAGGKAEVMELQSCHGLDIEVDSGTMLRSAH